MFKRFYDWGKNADINAIMAQQNKKKEKKRNFRPGCIFWIALILLVITFFIVKHKRIQSVIESTGFLTFFSKTVSDKDQEKKQPDVLRIVESAKNENTQQTKPVSEPVKKEVVLAENQPINTVKEKTEPVQETEKKPESTAPSYKVRDSILYFIVINDNGTTQLRKTTRSIKFTDSPLTSTIVSLLGGASSAEINNNYISLIPENTKLNRLWITEGTAYLDFNENFLFNSFGREGYIGQLKQIVYSATEFSTVKRIQILIDGKTLNYMGAEGIFIGKPLTRDSF